VAEKIFNVPTQSELECARKIVMQYGWNSMAYQILNPGMSLWFSKKHEGIIGFVETLNHFIIAGSPVSKEEHLENILTEFFHDVLQEGKKVCFFGAQKRISTILSAFTPTSTILLGAQPTWKPNEWLYHVNSKPSLRAQLQRARNKQIFTEVIKKDFDVIRDDLKNCLNEWIATRKLPPMHFLVEPNTLDQLEDRILVIAKKQKQIIGFCIASPIPLRQGWLIEQIVRNKDAPNGTAELLLFDMTTEIQKNNSQFITLGLSPLSQFYQSPSSHPAWLNFLLRSVKSYGNIFYNFKGLDNFKAKFNPTTWEPVFAITNEKVPTFSTLYAIATAFSVVSPTTFVLKGMLKYIQNLYKN
jgi:phosphatidylglycerol lysyltransferase